MNHHIENSSNIDISKKLLQEMKKKADAYRKSVFKSDNRMTVNYDQTRNKIFYSRQLLELTDSDLQRLGFYLMEMCYNENMNAIIENDHDEYWCHVSNLTRNKYEVDHWIKNHNPIFSYIDIKLVNELKCKYSFKYTDNINKMAQNDLLKDLINHDFFPSVWSGFAYLEGICRRLCSDYVTQDGDIKKDFEINVELYKSSEGNNSNNNFTSQTKF